MIKGRKQSKRGRERPHWTILTGNRVVQDEANEAADKHACGEQDDDDLVDGLTSGVHGFRMQRDPFRQDLDVVNTHFIVVL